MQITANTSQVGGFTSNPSATKTRPSNVTPYVAGQVLADTGTAVVWTFTPCARFAGGSGKIVSVRLTDTAKQALAPVFDLVMFTVAPSTPADGGAFNPSTVEQNNAFTVIPITQFFGWVSNGMMTATGLNLPFTCASGSVALYGITVVQNPYIPVSAEGINIQLGIEMD